MSTWIDAAIQRVSSLGLGTSSLGGRNPEHNFNQEVAIFQKITSELQKDEVPTKSINYFNKHFANKDDKELSSLDITTEISRIVRRINLVIESILSDQPLLEKVFTFLNSAMRIFYSSPKNDAAIFKIFHRFILTNDENIIGSASFFVHVCTKNSDLLSYFFSGEQLVTIWTSCYIENPIAYTYYTPLFNEVSTTYTPKDNESVEPFIEKVLDDFNDGLVQPQNLSVLMYFAASIVCKIDSGDFLIQLLPMVTDLAPGSENLFFFEPLLRAKTSNPAEIWNTLYSILEQNGLNITLLETALQALKNTGIVPDPKYFSYSMFIPRFIELSEDSQKLLFEQLKKSQDETKADFLYFVMPLSQTGISTEMLSNVIAGVKFGDEADEILQKFLIDQDQEEVELCLSSDEYFCLIAEQLVRQISSTSPKAKELLALFLDVFNRNQDQKTNPANNLLIILLQTVQPEIYMDTILDTLKQEKSDKWMQLLADISKTVESFNDNFIKMNGVELIPQIVETKAGLNFLASLVVDGPYEIIDDFIFKHFKETKLSSYDNKSLINLMMGVPQDTADNGFLRIPSLCAFVPTVPLRTPFDRYIYSVAATKYFTPNKEQITQFAVRFMNYDLALKIMKDPEFLSILTDPLFPHSIVFQMHPSARNCYIEMKRTNCCSIWFYITEIFGQTVLISVPGASLEINTNGNLFFGGHSASCSLKEWHLFSFSTSTKNEHKIITGYLDARKVAEIVTTDEYVITIGHNDPGFNNSIWFVSPFLHPSKVPLSEPEISAIFDQGPMAPTQRLMKESNGVRLVPYRGILRYMHLFGGPHFIFNLMLKTKSKEDFMLYIQSAFNLYHLNAFKNEDFFASIHYVLRIRLDLYTKQIEQILLREMTTDDGIDWDLLYTVTGDIFFISSPNVACKFLIDLLKMNHNLNEKAVQFFHLLIDAFVFIKCNEETIKNILIISKMFIKFKPILLNKIAMTVIAIPYCDVDSPVLAFFDDRFEDKQLMLITLLKENKSHFASIFNCEAAILFAIKLKNELCVDFLEYTAKICLRNKDYFNFTVFKTVIPHFYYLTKIERFWNFLFMLLTNQSSDSIEGYVAFPIVRSNIYPYMLELLTSVIPQEVSTGVDEGLSFKVLHTLYSIAIVQQVNLYSIIGSLQNLCSLGFGEKVPYPYPYPLSNRAPSQRRASRPRASRPSFEIYSDPKSNFAHDHLKYMDPELYDMMDKHMAKHPLSVENLNDLDIPEITVNPEKVDFDQLFESNISSFVSLLAAKCFIEVANETSSFKRAFGPLLIYGADVYPKEAVRMHQKVVLALLNERQKLPNDSFFYLIEFLTSRVIEGWWDDSIFDLFSKVILNLNTTHRSIIQFTIACFVKNSKKVKELVTMGNLLVNANQIFKYCIDNKNFLNSFIAILTKPEIISETMSFLKLIAPKIGNSELTSAVKSFQIPAYLESNRNIQTSFNDYYKQIENTAITNSLSVMSERLDNARKPRGPALFSFEKTSITQITYLRRAFRYEFFLRVNKGVTVLEPSITSMFKSSCLLQFCTTPPEKHSINSNSHPLSIPNKQVPLLYPYDCEYKKVESLFNVPESAFKNDIQAVAQELNAIHFAPKCLEGWSLPGHYTAGVTMLFKKIFNGVIEPFNLLMLSAPEPLECVGILSKDSLHVLMNARVLLYSKNEKDIHLIEEKMVSHYPLYENATQGLMGNSSLFIGHVVLSIPFLYVTIVLPRKYCYRPNAVDIYTANGCHYTFVIKNKKVLKLLLTKISTHKNTATRRGPGYSQRLLCRPIESVAKFWEHGIISNFDYLMFLNSVSGRSFNDFSQYPIFPWIISDFESKDSPKTFRDLSLPMGQINKERAKHYDTMFKETPPPHYFYGTHYSSPGYVLYYLMRIEPVTLFNVVLHKGFDQSDRVFLSFSETWKSASEENQADVKELIPEFYSSPSVLQNINKNIYPPRTNGTRIEEVILPPWAKNDPSLFIYKMRKALESRKVTKQLPKWIDLIFGYKQRGEEAIKAKNVFTPQSYDDYKIETNVKSKSLSSVGSSSTSTNNNNNNNNTDIDEDDSDYDENEDLSPDEISINNFGQCPMKLFNHPHPSQVKTNREKMIDAKLNINKIRKFEPHMRHIRLFEDEVYATSDLNHYVGIHPKLVTVQEGCININGKYQFFDPIFNVCSSNVSSDSFYLTITTKCGMVLNYWYHDDLYYLISQSSIPGEKFLACAVSSHFSIVIASSPDRVYMFDLTSGFILRNLKTKTPVQLIKFCETNDFIVLCEELTINVIDTHFALYNKIELDDPITSLSICDSVLWFEKPPFVTGHQSGTVNYWTLDMGTIDEDQNDGEIPRSKIFKKKINGIKFAKPFDSPIVAIEQIHDYTDIICINDDGDAVVISNATAHKRVLKPSQFEYCCGCGEKLVQVECVICSVCGLPYCLNCSSPGNTSPICNECLKLHKDDEAVTPSISQGEALISREDEYKK